MIVYDPRGHSWDTWCSLMAELFASNQLGTIPETKWRTYADALNGIGYFVNSAIPDQRNYKTWQEWATALSGVMRLNPT